MDCPKVRPAPVMLNTFNSKPFNTNGGNTHLNDLAYNLDEVIELMQSHVCQVSELRNSIEKLNNTKETSSQNIEFNLTKMIEQHLVQYEREHKEKLEAFIAESDKRNRALCEIYLHSVPKLVTDQVSERLSTIVKSEMQRNVLPFITNHLDNIQADLAHKLSGSGDHVTKETLIIEAFVDAVGGGIQAELQKTSDIFTSSIIPDYQKSTVQLCSQIQNMFLQGSMSYIEQCEGSMKQYHLNHDKSMRILLNISGKSRRLFQTTVQNFANQFHSDLTEDLNALQVNLIQNIRDNISKEIQKEFENHSVAINKPVLSVVHTLKEQIKQHLIKGEINEAFHKALLSSDFSIVEFTMEKADYRQVFYPCSLQQPVLLSLIQQLSVDLKNHTDLKDTYLADAFVSLDLLCAETREHAPKILRELYQRCQNFIMANPNSPLVGRFKMLMMAYKYWDSMLSDIRHPVLDG